MKKKLRYMRDLDKILLLKTKVYFYFFEKKNSFIHMPQTFNQIYW